MKYSFAGLTVEMTPRHGLLLSRAEKYLTDSEAKPDITIDVPDEIFADYKEAHPLLTDEECEYMLFGTVFYHRLVNFNGIMLHSSAVSYKGEAYVFSADCGTGKSTHTSLWMREFAGDTVMINDDKPAIRIIDGRIMCCGTPFSGKNDISDNKLYPLKAIAFISRAETNSIEPIPPSVSIPLIMGQTMIKFGEKSAERFLSLLSEILTAVPVYSLKCNMDPEAAHVALSGMNK